MRPLEDFLQEWVDNGRLQRQVVSGGPRATADQEDRLIVRSAVTAPDSSLSTIRCATHTRLSTLTIHRRLIEQNLRTYQPLHHLPLTPVHCRARLEWRLLGDPVGSYVPGPSLIYQQDNARAHVARVAINCFTACQTLPWPARLPDHSRIGRVWNMVGRRLHLPRNVDAWADN
ncbi:HTH_Tnp_Tc3_2 domain-containing protein [Trichonephila clavipes]|nr:HTH_Tnp_Tc3_2 domain-containing protein [Trichonephila clavipes]